MPKISRDDLYNPDVTLSANDSWVGTDANDSKRTKTYYLGDVADFINSYQNDAGYRRETGYVYWIQNLDFGSTEITYYIGGVYYVAAPVPLITLNPNNSLTQWRRDVFVVDTDNTLSVIEGTLADVATTPVIDYNTQLVVEVIDIAPNSNAPYAVSEVLVYDENAGPPTEYTATASVVSGTIDLASTTDPDKNTIHIRAIDTVYPEKIIFTASDYVATDNFSYLYLRLKNLIATSCQFGIVFYKDNVAVSNVGLRITHGIFGYDNANITAYQSIVVPITEIEFVDDFFNSFEITVIPNHRTTYGAIGAQAGTTMNFEMDNVRFIFGGQIFNVQNTYLALDDTFDTTYDGKAKHAPVVPEAENGLTLTRIVLPEDIYGPNGILPGGATVEHIANFDFRVRGWAYIIDSVVYEGPENYVEGIVTLSDAHHTDSRFDVFIINSDTKAQGTIALTGGVSGSVDSLTVNGVELLTGSIPYNTDLATTAIDVANDINSQVTTPNYFARAIAGTIYIDAVEKGVIPNGYVVAVTTTTITATKTDMAGGLDDTHSVGVLTGFAELNYQKPIPDPSTQVEITNRVTSPGEVIDVTTIVWNENVGAPTEFNVVAFPSGTIFNDATDPENGTTSGYVPAQTGTGTIIFYHPTNPIDYNTDSILFLAIKTANAWSTNQIRIGFQIALTGIAQSSILYYNRNAIVNIGFDHTLVGFWQTIGVPLGEFTYAQPTFNEIRIFFIETPRIDFDNIRHQGFGGPITVFPEYTMSYSEISQTHALLKDGVPVTTFNPTVRGATSYIVAASNSPTRLRYRADYICDGTDDQAEINTALALGNVQLVEGTYNIGTTPISMPSNRTLEGTGFATELNAIGHSQTNFIIGNTGTEGIIVRNLKLNGTAQSSGFGIYFENIGTNTGAVGTPMGVIDNIYALNFYQSSIEVRTCFNVIINNIHSITPFYDGVVVTKTVAGAQSAYVTIANSVFVNNTAGIWIEDGHHVTIQNNILNGDATNAQGQELIQVEASASFISILGNQCIGSQETGIWVGTANHISIMDNLVDGTDSAGAGITCFADDSIIANNIVRDCATYGIELDSLERTIVTGNKIENCSQDANNVYDGIDCGFLSDCVVSGNQVTRGATIQHRYGIYIESCVRTVFEGNQLYQSGATGAFPDTQTDFETNIFKGNINNDGTIYGENFVYSNNLTPPQITVDQNDYAPTGHLDTTVLRLDSDAIRNITGLAGGANGRLLFIENVGSFDINFSEEDVLSTLTNRFVQGFTLAPNTSALIRYDGIIARWRTIATSNTPIPNLQQVTDVGNTTTLNIGALSFNDLKLFAQTVIDADNIGIGTNALTGNTGTDAIAIGTSAMQNSTNNSSVSIGYQALQSSSGSSVVAIGHQAGGTSSGSSSTLVGYQAGQSNTGSYCTAIGYQAGKTNTGGSNTFIGGVAGGTGYTGSNNVIMGYYAALSSTRNLSNNVLIGYQAGRYIKGANTTAIGYNACILNTGSGTTSVGYQASNISPGSYNVAIGLNSGRYGNGGNYNTYIGYQAHVTFNEDTANAKNVANAATDVDTVLERITITGHGFGSIGTYVALKYSTTGTPIGGLPNPSYNTYYIVDANTIEILGVNMSSTGTDTHTFTPQFIYTNVTAIGANSENTASNQVMLGDANITSVRTANASYVATHPQDFMTLADVQSAISSAPVEIGFAASDETTDMAVGTQQFTMRMPYAMTLTDIIITLNDGPYGSTFIADVHNNGSTILSTLVSIDQEVRATGTVTLTGGASGSVDSITVNGVNIMSSSVPFATDLPTTATNVASNISAFASSPNYTANAVGAVITITSVTPGSGPNGYVVVANTTTITTSKTDMAGGVTEETSDTAAVPVVISSPNLAMNDEISVDVTQVGSIVPGTGLKVWFIGNKT